MTFQELIQGLANQDERALDRVFDALESPDRDELASRLQTHVSLLPRPVQSELLGIAFRTGTTGADGLIVTLWAIGADLLKCESSHPSKTVGWADNSPQHAYFSFALQELGEWKEAESERLATTFLQHSSPDMRGAAANFVAAWRRFMKGKGSAELVRMLIDALDDQEPWVAENAAWALRHEKAPSSVSSLRRLLASQNERVRTAVVAAFLATTAPIVQSELTRLVEDPHPWIRSLVSEHLDRLSTG